MRPAGDAHPGGTYPLLPDPRASLPNASNPYVPYPSGPYPNLQNVANPDVPRSFVYPGGGYPVIQPTIIVPPGGYGQGNTAPYYGYPYPYYGYPYPR